MDNVDLQTVVNRINNALSILFGGYLLGKGVAVDDLPLAIVGGVIALLNVLIFVYLE